MTIGASTYGYRQYKSVRAINTDQLLIVLKLYIVINGLCFEHTSLLIIPTCELLPLRKRATVLQRGLLLDVRLDTRK